MVITKQQSIMSSSSASSSTFRAGFLNGKVAVLTGGGSGITKGITEAFMEFGADTVIISRSQNRLDEASKELEARYKGRRCLPIAADVRDPEALDAAFKKALEQFGRIDILVNGAAGNFLAPAESLSVKGYRTVIEIDTIGTFNASKVAFSRYMKEHGGTIINLSMTLHYTGSPMQVHAGSAKAAIDAMTKHLAVEWGPYNVKVNAIAIGPIQGTEGMKRLMPKRLADEMLSKIPLGRWGDVSDISNTSLFLASDAASFITGSIITVDGGSWMTTGGVMYIKPKQQSKM